MLFLIIRDCSPGLCNSELGLNCQCVPSLLWDLHRCVWRAQHCAGENVLSQTLATLPNCSQGSLGICTPVFLSCLRWEAAQQELVVHAWRGGSSTLILIPMAGSTALWTHLHPGVWRSWAEDSAARQ